jgi:hypothetical protein
MGADKRNPSGRVQEAVGVTVAAPWMKASALWMILAVGVTVDVAVMAALAFQ